MIFLPKIKKSIFFITISLLFIINFNQTTQNEEESFPICGGFIEIDENQIDKQTKSQIDLSSIIIRAVTSDGITKEQSNVAQSGYFFLPLYEKKSVFLKISAPFGMMFEPEQYYINISQDSNLDELCKEDLNFKFKGYKVKGQISTFGTNDGPEGVSLSIYKLSDEVSSLQSTVSTEGGKFEYNSLFPGTYILKPSNEKERDIFDSKHSRLEFEVKINTDNFLEKALIVRGYRLSGRVESQGKALENVKAVIYSYDSGLVLDYKCEEEMKDDMEKIQSSEKKLAFCIVKTNDEGVFSFKNIPYGRFLVEVFYKDNDIEYIFSNQQAEVEVFHKDSLINTVFEVIKVNINGKVIDTKGYGISNVIIKIDGQSVSSTDENGEYSLNNLYPGNYDIEAYTENMYFDALSNIIISAHNKSIPNLIVKEYKLCGLINIEANDLISTAKRTVVLVESDSKKERRTITDSQGKFCFDVSPGKYHVYPFLSQEEKKMELHLNPEYIDLEVENKPILDCNFYQSKVEISGEINLKVEMINEEGFDVYLSSVKTDKITTVKAIKKENVKDFSFVFSNVLSGQYKVYIKRLEYCWNNEEIELKVQNMKISNIRFTQVGYSLFYNTNNDMNIEITSLANKDVKQTIFLKKDSSKICLEKEGEYIIKPKSCYKFEKEEYIYTTKDIQRLNLIPTEFVVQGMISIHNKVKEVFNDSNLSKIISIKINIEEIVNDSLRQYKTVDGISINEQSIFNFYTQPKKILIITPEIVLSDIDSNSVNITTIEKQALLEEVKKLIFFPKLKQIKVEETCFKNYENLRFELQIGYLIKGKVIPPTENVKVSAKIKETNDLISQVETDKNGEYLIGPIFGEYKYDLNAVKDGYKIISIIDSNDFTAEKLSLLRVKIIDTNKNPVPSVFISLSSSNKSFKINNNTNSEGYFDFYELFSGEYYIKPLLKEYRFHPNQKQISIVGGEHYEEVIVAERVAFSLIGKVKLYSNDNIDDITIQAISIESQQIFESSIDRNNEYRIKGLTPFQNYIVKVKIPNDSNIEKAIPSSLPIELGKEDRTDINFILIRKPEKIDIRGHLMFYDKDENSVCLLDRIKNFRVELYDFDSENEEKPPVQKGVLSSCMFIYKSLEKKKYKIKVVDQQGKTYTKVYYDEIVDLLNDKDIEEGVKKIIILANKVNENASDNLNYSVFSPILICLLLFVIFNWELSTRAIEYFKETFMKEKKNEFSYKMNGIGNENSKKRKNK